jgi:hypothetical protein
MKGILRIALAAAVVFGLVQSRFASASPLEGKSFVGETGEKGKTKGDKDTFVFKEGRFRSTACDRYGFGDAHYAVKQDGGKMVVTAETTSKKEGTMTWTLTVDGDTLTGVSIWKKGDKAPKEYWVKASLKK